MAMMTSPNHYSQLHKTLTQMPTSLINADEKMSPKSPPEEQRKPALSRRPHSASMPPPPYEDDNRRKNRQRRTLLTSSMNAPTSPVTTATEDAGFTRDFFGNRRKSIKRNAWFSKRNLKVDDDENDSNELNDSLRDPLNLHEVFKREKPALSHNSARTFDYDYANMEGRTQMEQMRIRQDQQQLHGSREQQSSGLEQPRQLTTLQEQVRRRHEKSADMPDSPPRPQNKHPVTRAAAAPTRQHSNNSGLMDDTRQMRIAMDEAINEMHLRQDRRYKSSPLQNNRYEDQDDQQIYRDQRQRSQQLLQSQRYLEPRRQRQNEPFSTRGYIQDLVGPRQPHQQTAPDEWEENSLMHDIIRATGARGPNGELLSRNQMLVELELRLDEQQSHVQEQDYALGATQVPRQQRQLRQENHQSLQDRRTSNLPDNQTWIQDVLQSAKKGTISPDVLEALIESVAEEKDTSSNADNRNSVESWMIDALQTAKEGPCSREVLEALMESASEDKTLSPLEGEHRDSSDSWIVDALQSAKKEGYSADALKALVDTVAVRNAEAKPQPPPDEEEPIFFQDRNSIDSWMADAHRTSSANPDILQELLGVKDGSAGQDSSNTKHGSSGSSKLQHHSVVHRDSRGPVPTDDMLNDSLISFQSGSSGSRVIGDNVLVIQRKKPANDIPSAFMDSGLSDKSRAKEGGGSAADDDINAHDLIAQLGQDADIETIPNDVLAAFGLTRNQLRRAESTDAQARNAAAKAPVFKSSEDSRSVISKTSTSETKSKLAYRQRSSPDDEVSWVEEQKLPVLNVATEKGKTLDRRISDGSLSSSQREVATDNRGPIPESDMLEETFAGISLNNRESVSGSSKNLVHAVDENKDSQHNSNHQSSETMEDIKPSMGFMRHLSQHRSTPIALGCSAHEDLAASAMKKRLDILETIEHGRWKQSDEQHPH